jgi:hypothetical protein
MAAVDLFCLCLPSECLAAPTTAARGGYSAALLLQLGCQAAMALIAASMQMDAYTTGRLLPEGCFGVCGCGVVWSGEVHAETGMQLGRSGRLVGAFNNNNMQRSGCHAGQKCLPRAVLPHTRCCMSQLEQHVHA